jgi:hypothetical protein
MATVKKIQATSPGDPPGVFLNQSHTVILEYFNIKNKHFLVLPSSFSRNSSAPKRKRIFQMLDMMRF